MSKSIASRIRQSQKDYHASHAVYALAHTLGEGGFPRKGEAFHDYKDGRFVRVVGEIEYIGDVYHTVDENEWEGWVSLWKCVVEPTSGW